MKYSTLSFGLALGSTLIFALGACGNGSDTATSSTSGDPTTGSASGGMGGTGPSSGPGGPTTSGAGAASGCDLETGDACPPPVANNPGVKSAVNKVTGRVLDVDGNPVNAILFDVCGTDQCLSGTSDDQGNALVDGQGKELIDVHLIYGHGDHYMQWTADIPASDDFGEIHAVAFPDHSEGIEICPGATTTQGDVTLEFADPAHIKHDLINAGGDKTKLRFRSVNVPFATLSLPGLDPSHGFELVYGLAPIHTKICPAAKMTIPNSKGWAAGAAVEFFVHGTTTFSDSYAAYGDWKKVSDGAVSADGMTVSTSEGGGIPVLAPVGIRLQP